MVWSQSSAPYSREEYESLLARDGEPGEWVWMNHVGSFLVKRWIFLPESSVEGIQGSARVEILHQFKNVIEQSATKQGSTLTFGDGSSDHIAPNRARFTRWWRKLKMPHYYLASHTFARPLFLPPDKRNMDCHPGSWRFLSRAGWDHLVPCGALLTFAGLRSMTGWCMNFPGLSMNGKKRQHY